MTSNDHSMHNGTGSGSHVGGPALVQETIAQAVGQPVTSVRVQPRQPLAHQSNRLYDAWADERHLIVKEFLKPDEIHEAPAREARALELVAPLDLGPRLVHFQSDSTPALGPIVVYEWMAGEMWAGQVPSRQDLARLAGAWLQLNALSPEHLWMSRGYERSLSESARHFHERLLAYAAWAKAAYPPAARAAALCLDLMERRRAVIAELERAHPVQCFCRGDARFANVIRRPDGRVGLVDWEDSGLRDPARDIADLLTAADQEDALGWDGWQAFLQPYLKGRQAVDRHLARRAELYLALFPLLWLVLLTSRGVQRAQGGQLPGWSINGMPPNHRLRRYLARAVAWPAMRFDDQLAALADVTFFPDDGVSS